MIVRFASWVTRGFLSPLLCLSLDILSAAKENLWDQGNFLVTQQRSRSQKTSSKYVFYIKSETYRNYMYMYMYIVVLLDNIPLCT